MLDKLGSYFKEKWHATLLFLKWIMDTKIEQQQK